MGLQRFQRLRRRRAHHAPHTQSPSIDRDPDPFPSATRRCERGTPTPGGRRPQPCPRAFPPPSPPPRRSAIASRASLRTTTSASSTKSSSPAAPPPRSRTPTLSPPRPRPRPCPLRPRPPRRTASRWADGRAGTTAATVKCATRIRSERVHRVDYNMLSAPEVGRLSVRVEGAFQFSRFSDFADGTRGV